jgi:hypothetical protein
MAREIDEAKLGEFMGRMVGFMTGGALCFGIWIGDVLGLYRALAADNPTSAAGLAEAAGVRGGRVHPLPPRHRDADEPHPRGSSLSPRRMIAA